MKKRGGRKTARSEGGAGGGEKRALPLGGAAAAPFEREDDLVFEDDFGDEVAGDEAEGEVSEAQRVVAEHPSQLPKDEEERVVPVKVFRPGIDSLADGEALEYSADAYVMYHTMSAEWPCLSLDVVPDMLGTGRSKFPLSCYFVAGTQADKPKNNALLVMKASQLSRTQNDDDSEADGIDEDDDPILEIQSIPHFGGINRVRVMPQKPNLVAVWSDQGVVNLMDIRHRLSTLDIGSANGFAPPEGYRPGSTAPSEPVHSFSGHATEGFALGWSPVVPGRLATGDCSKFMYVWDAETGSAVTALGSSTGTSATSGSASWGWRVSNTPYTGHTGSVEDIVWSPVEPTVFASCSVDGTLRIWDTRDARKSQLHVKAHDCDVNVLSWNSQRAPFLLAAGADDGSFSVWDMRDLLKHGPQTEYNSMYSWHRGPVTSIQWDPYDENVLAVASADDTVTIWDLSMEADTEQALSGQVASGAAAAGGDEDVAELPPQLLFVHQGQNDVKEATFHPQVPGMVLSTAGDGFNLWKPDIDVQAEPEEDNDSKLA